MLKWVLSAIIVGSLAVAGCQSTGDGGTDKETTGTVIGALIGGLLGSTIGEGKVKTLAVIGGAALGGVLGNRIGAALDERDKDALAAEAASSLSNSNDGVTTAYQNPETGTRATFTPTQTRSVERDVVVVRDKTVAPTPPLTLIGKQYGAVSSAKVRSAPSTSSDVVAGLKSGEVVHVVGKVKTANWYQVARNGRSIGYVYAPLLEPASAENSAAQLREPVELDDVDVPDDAVVESVPAEIECRTIEYDVEAKNGAKEQSTFEACKAADGAWELG